MGQAYRDWRAQVGAPRAEPPPAPPKPETKVKRAKAPPQPATSSRKCALCGKRRGKHAEACALGPRRHRGAR
jgi:hypothetical protein